MLPAASERYVVRPRSGWVSLSRVSVVVLPGALRVDPVAPVAFGPLTRAQISENVGPAPREFVVSILDDGEDASEGLPNARYRWSSPILRVGDDAVAGG